MGDFFGDLRSGIQFPQVVMNQGPLPSAGGLPQPLHESADARINYNSTLLGNITPYAYGEPGYLSSQNAYLNIPHKVPKIVPVVFLPEAKVGAREFFDLSHPIDDGDLAFVLRLNRASLFCTGLKNGDMRRAGLGTAIDPLINLCTLNYILSGMQLGLTHRAGDLWEELLFNLDPYRFGKTVGLNSRNYAANPIGLDDIIHMVHHCIRPFGITRGSEKQGGQDEATLAPATWPVSFVVSLTIDGKESNVVNLWHNHELHAGNDLVLRLKLMPLRPYTLNHYYKGVKRQTWSLPDQGTGTKYVWQLVPDLLHLDMATDEEQAILEKQLATLPAEFRRLKGYSVGQRPRELTVDAGTPWQDLGYWHIGRSQIMTGKYGIEEYWHNDLANSLKTNHLDITFQPSFCHTPFMVNQNNDPEARLITLGMAASGGRIFVPPPSLSTDTGASDWTPALGLERMMACDSLDVMEQQHHNLGEEREPEEDSAWDSALGLHPLEGPGASVAITDEDIGTLCFTDDPVPAPEAAIQPPQQQEEPPSAKKPAGVGSKPGRRGKNAGSGSLLRMDGTSEISTVDML